MWVITCECAKFLWLVSHELFREWTMKRCASHTSPHDRMSLLLWYWFIGCMSSNQSIPHNRQPTVIDSWVAADQMEKKRKIKKEKNYWKCHFQYFWFFVGRLAWLYLIFVFGGIRKFHLWLCSCLNYRSDSYSLFIIGIVWLTRFEVFTNDS